ncbi:Multidrug resistance-associated protein 1 [Taenia solium]|eukprot:TsM_001073000 transcript=TsM_001073000 gene=TsM_001073000
MLSIPKRQDLTLCPEKYVSFPSRITFFWVTSLIILGYRKTLELSHLWVLEEKHLSASIVPSFLRNICKYLHVNIAGDLDVFSDYKVRHLKDKLDPSPSAYSSMIMRQQSLPVKNALSRSHTPIHMHQQSIASKIFHHTKQLIGRQLTSKTIDVNKVNDLKEKRLKGKVRTREINDAMSGIVWWDILIGIYRSHGLKEGMKSWPHTSKPQFSVSWPSQETNFTGSDEQKPPTGKRSAENDAAANLNNDSTEARISLLSGRRSTFAEISPFSRTQVMSAEGQGSRTTSILPNVRIRFYGRPSKSKQPPSKRSSASGDLESGLLGQERVGGDRLFVCYVREQKFPLRPSSQ